MHQNQSFVQETQKIHIAEPPKPGATYGQPFAPGTGGSQNSRYRNGGRFSGKSCVPTLTTI